MTKQFYIVILIICLLGSIALGLMACKGDRENENDQLDASEFDWMLPLSGELTSIEGLDDKTPFFITSGKLEEVLYDQTGKAIDKGAFVYASREYYSYHKGDRIGLKNSEGKIVVPAKFVCIDYFNGDYGIASDEDFYYAFDQKGNVILDTTKDNTTLNRINGRYVERQFPVASQIVDLKTGKNAIEMITEYTGLTPVGDKIYTAQTNQSTGGKDCYVFIDEKFIPTFDNQVYWNVGEYSQGYCYAEKIVDGRLGDLPKEPATLNGYINENGVTLIEADDSLYGNTFSEDKSLVYYEDKVRCINPEGKTVFEIPMEKKIKMDFSDLTPYLNTVNESYFVNGVAAVGNGVKRGLINEMGEWVIKPVFDELRIVGENLAAVRYDNQWGVIKIDKQKGWK